MANLGLLEFYALRILRDRVEVPAVVVFPPPPPQPERVIYVLQTFQVDVRNVADGDFLTVYVDVADTREASNVPKVVQIAISERLKARAFKDYAKADALYQKIVDAGYRLLRGANNADILAKKYGIRLSVYGEDKYGLPVGRKCAWHNASFDNRPELAKWEMEARASQVGLWELSNPEKPLEWKKNNPEMPWDWRIPITTKRTL
ncbi:uncharacterized 38.1 kDa protein-like [Papaver somniferum]|uniref:uncharacterized 38.1 kDa protein-like n=1 Tax=Papaver somniferum TaxID=3469 RepID=UPI000E6FFAAD|nr:uncharacterized 38.1 kDa protein-like [Papaver somniferum]